MRGATSRREQLRVATHGRVRAWIPQAETLERAHQLPRNEIVAELLVVGGNHVPGSGGETAATQCVAIGVRVVIPFRPVVEIARPKLPVLLRVVDAVEQPAALLLTRDVEEELADDDAA